MTFKRLQRLKLTIFLLPTPFSTETIVRCRELRFKYICILQGNFYWILSESSVPDTTFSGDLEEILRGVFVVSVSGHFEDYGSYISSLTPSDHGSIPKDWFDEFWQHYFKCRLSESDVPIKSYIRVCGDRRISK